MKIIITGGAGFIGSAVVKLALIKGYEVINIDNLSYAGNKFNLKSVINHKNHKFLKVDICNQKKIFNIFKDENPDYVMHLAACSHVDNSIKNPKEFLNVNILGTYNLLQASNKIWFKYKKKKKKFRFHLISTDEVYGTLGKKKSFTENSNYAPNNPYSATKASAELLVRSWNKTFGLPTIVSNCSNNYGPHQFPEKLIPVVILNALDKKNIPIYGKGNNVRDWLYVEDHAEALFKVLLKGKIGSTYNIGDNNELSNLEIVRKICKILDKKFNKKNYFNKFIKFVNDRPGHDFRYAIDSSKIKKELRWKPKTNFNYGLEKTIDWYIKYQSQMKKLISKKK